MGLTLLIMRHGKSDWHADYGGDFMRPLNNRGRKAAVRMAEHIRKLGLEPSAILASPATRALTTAELIQDTLSIEELTTDEQLYGASCSELLDIITHHTGDSDCLLLVGHNPGVEELVNMLTGDKSVYMKTCSLAVIECTGDGSILSKGDRCKLLGIYHPRELGN